MDFDSREAIDRAIAEGKHLNKGSDNLLSTDTFLWEHRHPYYGYLTDEAIRYYREVLDAFPVLDRYQHRFFGDPQKITTTDNNTHLWYRLSDFPVGGHAWKSLGQKKVSIIYIRESEITFTKYVFHP